MDTKQLPITRSAHDIGEVVDLDEAYPRKIKVPWLILIPTVLLATVGSLPIALIGALRGKRVPLGAGDQSIRQMREGPEISVMPMWVRYDDGETVEMEIHGYVQSDRLILRDRVQVRLRRQRRRGHPLRAMRIVNLTTGQNITPHPHTIWAHLGLGPLLQAVIGTILTILLIIAWIVGG